GEIGANSLVFVAEINLDGMLDAGARAPRFAEIEKYPPVSRDIAMLVPEVVTHAEVAATIAGAEEPLLVDVQLFDLFTAGEGSSVAVGKKSLAYTLTYRDRNRTLTNDEVTVVHDRIRERIKRELGAELRE
ncbi:MAG: phenylalanine--tRNA ligase subunit beta, partial [Chthoniobacterales bacterium]|nr:phenylalanine--tRNA ligase subunit beta [Chthoniobacterales bacterium]